MVYLFLADGFEEIEALAVVDILRRAKIEINTVSVSGKAVTGTHGIKVDADISARSIKLDSRLKGVILPGGMPGTSTLAKSADVQKAIAFAAQNGILTAAICAAPSVLGKCGVLVGKKATCYPGYEKDLTGAVVCGDAVCVDGNVITAKGAGVSLQFAFAIVSYFLGDSLAKQISEDMQCPR